MDQPLTTPPTAKMSPQLIIVIVVVVVLLFGLFAVVGLGLLGAMGAAGTRKYLEQSKAAEGRVGAAALARGVAACASGERLDPQGAAAAGLPATTGLVPPSLDQVSAKRYMSSTADWQDAAFKCAGFSMDSPQSFQYQWVTSGPRAGVARALADLDGDGKPEHRFEVDVTCREGAGCEAGQVRDVR